MSSPKDYQYLRKLLTEGVVLQVQPHTAHCAAAAARVQRQTPKEAVSTVTLQADAMELKRHSVYIGRLYRPQGAFSSKSGP